LGTKRQLLTAIHVQKQHNQITVTGK